MRLPVIGLLRLSDTTASGERLISAFLAYSYPPDFFLIEECYYDGVPRPQRRGNVI